MTEIIIFLTGFVFAIVTMISFAFIFKRVGITARNVKSNNVGKAPETDKYQKELERQYNNLMNYDGRVQRGVDDED